MSNRASSASPSASSGSSSGPTHIHGQAAGALLHKVAQPKKQAKKIMGVALLLGLLLGFLSLIAFGSLLLSFFLFAACITLSGLASICVVAFGQQRHRSYQAGAVGELAVAQCLAGISDCHIFHDLFLRNASGKGGENIDHVLLCTEGIFTIEVKNHKGISVERTGIRRYGEPDHKILAQAKRQSKKLAQLLIVKTTPIVVFVHSSTQLHASELDGVHICTLETLPRLISDLRRRRLHSLGSKKFAESVQKLRGLV